MQSATHLQYQQQRPPRHVTLDLAKLQSAKSLSRQSDAGPAWSKTVTGNPQSRQMRTAGSKKQAAAAAASDRHKAAKASLPPVMEDSPEPAEEMDVLLGCTKCRYLKGGCGACRDKPALERPKSLRWKPDGLRQQKVSSLCCTSNLLVILKQC